LDHKARFLELTATDAWLSAEQIVDCLNCGDYWAADGSPPKLSDRLAHVRQRLAELVDEQGRPLFASVPILVNHQTVLVYKQERRIAQRRRPVPNC
jgi:hypothetical protein